MPKAITQTPKKFEMLKALREPSTTKFEMGKSSKPATTEKFEMLHKKTTRPLTGFLKTMEL